MDSGSIQAGAEVVLAVIAIGGVVVALFRWPHTDQIERVRVRADIDRLDADVKRLIAAEQKRDALLADLQRDIAEMSKMLSRIDERTRLRVHGED